MEDLNLAGLCRTPLAKSFQDAGIREAVRQLEYKQAWRGGTVVKADRWFPSSKRCHACLAVNGDLTLADRQSTCPACGTRHDRDLNAAINLQLEGERLLRLGSGYVETLSSPVELATTAPASAVGKLRAVKQELDDPHLWSRNGEEGRRCGENESGPCWPSEHSSPWG